MRPKQSNAGRVQIGWASRDITPNRTVNLQGQFCMRISKGIMDPLTLTALAVSTDGTEEHAAIFVSCDAASVPPQIVAQCRAAIRAKAPAIDVTRLILNATHTHTAPQLAQSIYPPVPKGVMTPEEYAALFVERMAEVVVEAWANRRSGGISWGLGTAVVGRNRRATYFDELAIHSAGIITDGHTKMYGNTNDKNFSHIEGYEDHYVDLLYTWDHAKHLTGVIVNLACPSQEVEADCEISADFWHDIRQALRKHYGKHIQVLAQCSSAGDQSPHRMWYKAAEQRMLAMRGLSMRQEIGRRVANAVEDVLPLARQAIRQDVSLTHVVRTIALPHRVITEREIAEVRADLATLEANTPSEKNQASHYVSLWRCREALKRYEAQKINPKSPMELHVIRLGDLAFVTNRFELFLDYGIRIKARSPAIQTFIVQLAADDIYGSYLPTARAVAGKGYGSNVYDNEVGPEGGQALVEETLQTLKSLWLEAEEPPVKK